MVLTILAAFALAISFAVDLGHRTRYLLGGVLLVCIASAAVPDSRALTMASAIGFTFAVFALIVDATTRRFSSAAPRRS